MAARASPGASKCRRPACKEDTNADLFTINSDGHLVIASRINREILSNSDLVVTLVVDDSVGNSASADLTISVEDINDNIPTCGQSVFIIQIEEAGTESNKMIDNTLVCTDKDLGNNAVVVLNITSGNDDNVFRYEGQELWGSPDQLDYEGLDTVGYKYTLVVEAMDSPDEGNRNKNPTTLRLMSTLRSRARKEGTPIQQIFEDEMRTLTVDEAATTPSFASIDAVLYRHRRKNRPPLRKTLADVCIEDQWAETSDGSQFLAIDDGVDDRILVFSTEDMMETMQSADTLFMDGTFCSCPSLWNQLYAVHCLSGSTMFPDAFALMPNGQRLTYIELSQQLKNVLYTITGKNEFAPHFTSPVPDSSANFPEETVSEDTAPGTIIITYAASDDDHGNDGEVHYEIVSVTSDTGASEPNIFTIDGDSGTLILSESLDADSDTGGVAYYSVVVKAVDSGATPLETQATQKILLGGANDNAPVFINVDNEVFVDENASLNDVVVELTVTDPDGDSVTISADGGDNTVFGIDGNNIVVLGTLDFETRTCYSLDISASDGTFSNNIYVTIKVSNVNDEPPTIRAISSPSMMEETAVGTVLHGLYTTIDPDVGDTVTYSHSGTDASYFSISDGGDLQVAQRVDLEAGTSSLSIDLTATDAGGNAVTESLTITVIDVNDNTPSCDKEVYELELEEASGDKRGNFDSGRGGDPDGVFRFQGLELWGAANNIDYESLETTGYKYYLSVAVTDEPSSTPANTGHILVIVKVTGKNEHTPTWSSASLDGAGNLLGVTVSEDALVGNTVTSLAASDDDQGPDGRVGFELVSVTSDTGATVSDKFWLDPESGDLIIATLLDADSTTGGVTYYDVAVKAQDGNATPLEVQGSLRVTVNAVNDNAPIFSDTEFIATVPEDVTPGFTVLNLSLDDVDGDTPTLTVVGTWSSLFKGEGASILTNGKLDYETEKCYSVQVRASDGVHTTDHFVTIQVTDVSDEPPVLSVYAGVTVSEELPLGVIIGDVFSVTDPDTTETFTYSISGSHSSLLDINETTGHLYISSNIDRDGGVAYLDDLSLTVTDSAGLTDTAAFRLDITDINDVTPAFSQSVYSVQTTENSAYSKLVPLSCTDDDSGINGDVSLSIPAADNPDGIFSLVGSEMYADGSLIDYETTSSYSITVLCVDSAGSVTAKTGVTVVQIQVVGDNEFDPVWDTIVPDGTGMFPGVSISESDSPGTLVQTFSATDQDEGVDGDVTYDIMSITSAESTAVADLFKMDKDMGTLTTAVNLDADVDTGGSAYYDVKVRAKDLGPSSREMTGTIRVTVNDTDDNGPKFTQQLFSGAVQCSNAINDVVAQVTVGDADSTVGASTFSLPEASTLFAVDGSTGDVSLLVAPDTLAMTELRQFVVVKATASSNTALVDTTTVYVSFDYCGSTTTATTETTTTSTTTPAPPCQPGVDTEVIALATLCALMGGAVGVAVFLNAKSIMAARPSSVQPSLPKKGQGDLERPLETSNKMEVEDLTLEDPADQFVFDSLPPYSTIGGRFEQLP
ncbi:protocadherin Fat 4-like [Haliotis rubra]|uniref:protocadherin Fat 4-like n=1 Tax=Haliotis rubra TaxID=36100 RepID=UPI001EE5095D|nr:protocadherin Fat 4-like [Haliotis rubra]